MLTHAHVCSRMLTYAHVVYRGIQGCTRGAWALTYAHACSRMLAYAHVCSRMLTYARVCSRMLTHARVCSRMLTYAHVCSRMLTGVFKVAWRELAVIGCVSPAWGPLSVSLWGGQGGGGGNLLGLKQLVYEALSY